MRSPRRTYYDLFSLIYDFIIRLHSQDTGGLLRNFIARKANLFKGDNALDLCTGTGSVAIELAKQVGEKGLIVGLDFSQGMIEKARKKAKNLTINQLHLVQANASQLPFKKSSFHAVTCSHAFYELKGDERAKAINEVARVLTDGGRFCLMEHAKPQRWISRLFFYVRIFFLGARDVREFLAQEESIFGNQFKSITKEMSPTGQSKLTYGEKEGASTIESLRRPHL
ncbi:MAG TPA: class I SAM-dependent methyltransferase [Thermodesulfobacteriota bacterium]|nr:class I SAM-dependent methyltransferase [Thermodesulfobacteriota bacterium]